MGEGGPEIKNLGYWWMESAVCFLIEADRFSIDISIDTFFQSAILIVFLEFQFMMIVFLVMIRATEIILLAVLFKFMFDMSPSKQSAWKSGMWQPRRNRGCQWCHARIVAQKITYAFFPVDGKNTVKGVLVSFPCL